MTIIVIMYKFIFFVSSLGRENPKYRWHSAIASVLDDLLNSFDQKSNDSEVQRFHATLW